MKYDNRIKFNIFFLAIIMFLVCLRLLVNKQGEVLTHIENVQGNNTEVTNLLSDDYFIIKNDTTFMELGGEYTNIKTNEKIISVHYANEKFAYDVFEYENFIINVLPKDDGIISRILIITPNLKTSKGICIGDTIFDIFEKYGQIEETAGNTYIYHGKGKYLSFYVDDNDKVIKIQLELI